MALEAKQKKLTLNDKLRKQQLWKPNQKLTLKAKLENNSSGSQTKKLTLNATENIIALEVKPRR